MYLHDLWSNFVSDEPNASLIPEFFEWDKDDNVMLFDQVPLIIVDENVYNYLVYGLNEVPTDIAMHVYRKAYFRINHERKQINYAFVVTDKKRVMVIEAGDDLKVYKKSRLIPRQFILTLELASGQSPVFVCTDKVNVDHYDNYAGFTRKEKSSIEKIKQFIKLRRSDEVEMLKYLLVEWDHNLYGKLNEKTITELKGIALHKLKDPGTDEKLQHVEKIVSKLDNLKQVK